MQNNDPIYINGYNIQRDKTIITLISPIGSSVDLTQFTTSIEYVKTQDKEFGYNLSNQPSQIGLGNITVSGSLTLSDGGIYVLDILAASEGGVDLLDLGQVKTGVAAVTTFSPARLVVEYYSNTNKLIKETLEYIMFTERPSGVSNGTLLNERSVPFTAGKARIEYL